MKKQFTLAMVLITSLVANVSHAQIVAVQQANYTHKPIVEMTINNKKTWVLLDTGSDITILDIKSKKEFGFNTFEKDGYMVPGFGSENNRLRRATNVNLMFGDVRLRSAMFAFDLTTIAESIENRTGKRITAIIGTNLMRTYGFVIDMGNNSVVMYCKIKNSEVNKPYLLSLETQNEFN
ncbi:MAG: aspartyl protease family protein [Cyclobacteriaceae bacterium]|nr:aspartyl protease family protein [Cyclobacteriaceae bacterium]